MVSYLVLGAFELLIGVGKYVEFVFDVIILIMVDYLCWCLGVWLCFELCCDG